MEEVAVPPHTPLHLPQELLLGGTPFPLSFKALTVWGDGDLPAFLFAGKTGKRQRKF